MPTLLAVGEDLDLLKTRAQVLRTTGASVICCYAAGALKFIEEREFDLIVLCHSIGQRAAMQITEIAHTRSANTLVLRMICQEAAEQAFNDSMYDAVSAVEPSSLVRITADLLKRQTRSEVPRSDVQMRTRTQRKEPANCPADIGAGGRLIEDRRAG